MSGSDSQSSPQIINTDADHNQEDHAKIEKCVEHLHDANLTTNISSIAPVGAFITVSIDAPCWSDAAAVAKYCHLRWSALWAEQTADTIVVMALFGGKDGHLLLTTQLPSAHPELPSQAGVYPNADRPERHLQDMFGIRFSHLPYPRRWTRHQAWDATQFPLRKEFPLAGAPPADTPTDHTYPFIKMEGEDIYEVPVGPVHAGIIEPGHFRFHTIGEDVLRLEIHLGYVHKGIEKIAEGRDLSGLLRLAARVSGDSTIAHSWAAAQAVEHALQIEVPPRALSIRAILAERERIANHCGDIGAICNDVGFSFAMVQFSALRERIQRLNVQLFGHRLLMDCIQIGGVNCDLDANGIAAIVAEQKMLYTEVAELMPMILEYPSLQDRLRTTGILPYETAMRLGTLGYVGRASGIDYDLRRDAPYPPYHDLEIKVPLYSEGDVAKRTRVRGDEILLATELITTLLHTLPDGAIVADNISEYRDAAGIGMVEGWRGETVAYVHLNAAGKVERYFARDPSWLNWPALEELIHGNIIPDFPVCNKSINGSYSGHDL
ncbi:MAG: NADH-quinone oxidoreductase subunit C [Desulfuromonadaceae bacterium]|nr:NADH-quinone oxidoreductase subunit C [Desulfuromonadaceae bacterium]